MASSLSEVGLINPITLNKDLRLITGYHRLEAAKALGWEHIDARVMAIDDLEATKISTRTKAGLARVKAQGKVLGRPDFFEVHAPELAPMKAEGYSQGRMSWETGLAVNTVKGYLKGLELS